MFSHVARVYCSRIFDCYYAALLVVAAMKNSCCSRAQVGAREPEVYGRPFGTLKSVSEWLEKRDRGVEQEEEVSGTLRF